MPQDGNFTMEALFQEIVGIRNMQQETLVSNKTVNEKLDGIQNAVQPLSQEVSKHAKELKYLDHEKRRRNLIIFGLSEISNESLRDLENKVVHLITRTLEVSTFSLSELDFTKRIKSQSVTPRPVLLAVTTQRRKFEILRSTGKLKGSKIFVHEGASPEVRQQEKNLRVEMKRLRDEGKYAVIRSGRLITHDTYRSVAQQTSQHKRALSESPNIDPSVYHKRANMNISNLSSDMSDSITDQENNAGLLLLSENTNTGARQAQAPPAYLASTQTSGYQFQMSGGTRTLTQSTMDSFVQKGNEDSKNG